MLYDLKQIIDGGETNYISATRALYLDLFNIFQSPAGDPGDHLRRRLARLLRNEKGLGSLFMLARRPRWTPCAGAETC